MITLTQDTRTGLVRWKGAECNSNKQAEDGSDELGRYRRHVVRALQQVEYISAGQSDWLIPASECICCPVLRAERCSEVTVGWQQGRGPGLLLTH